MIPHISIIVIILFSLTSCGENESEQKEAEKKIIESEYPLLGLDIPNQLIENVAVVRVKCQEITNINSFETESDFLWSKGYKKDTGEITLVGLWMKILFSDGPSDRYDREVPPDWCDYDGGGDLSVSDYIKGLAICTRHVRGYTYDQEYVSLAKEEEAVCELRVVERLDCLPDRMFLEERKPNQGLKEWQKLHQHQACSAPHFAEYRKQTLARWQKHKEQLQKENSE